MWPQERFLLGPKYLREAHFLHRGSSSSAFLRVELGGRTFLTSLTPLMKRLLDFAEKARAQEQEREKEREQERLRQATALLDLGSAQRIQRGRQIGDRQRADLPLFLRSRCLGGLRGRRCLRLRRWTLCWGWQLLRLGPLVDWSGLLQVGTN